MQAVIITGMICTTLIALSLITTRRIRNKE
nr:MAG TPA_asm: hypothetical protein [Caudoviricetes sp.]